MGTIKKESRLHYELGEFRKAATLGKSGKNPMFKSQYSTLGDVLKALENIADHGLGFEQHIHDNMLITTVMHLETGEAFSSAMPLHPEKPTPQGLIACVTYYRRVQLMTMFGLNAEDDDGNLASSDSGKSLPAGATPGGAGSPSAPSGIAHDFDL